MKITHDYAARIDYDLWMDCLRVKELDGGTTSINALVNEGLKLVRDRKMQEILHNGNRETHSNPSQLGRFASKIYQNRVLLLPFNRSDIVVFLTY